MDDRRFDRLARTMAGGSRRAAVRLTAGAALAALTARLGLRAARAGGDHDDGSCVGKHAFHGNDCRTTCCRGTDCRCCCATDVGGNRRCVKCTRDPDHDPRRSLFRPGPRCRRAEDCGPNEVCVDYGPCRFRGKTRRHCVRSCPR